MNTDLATVDHDAPTARDEMLTRIAEYAADADGAYAKATERARRSDTADFTAWCSAQDLDPFSVTPDSIRAYIRHMDAKRLAVSTITRRLQSVAHLYKAAQLEPPTRAEKVRLELRKIKKRIADTREARGKGQAEPATYDRVTAMLSACDTAMLAADATTKAGQRARLAAIRDAAMIALAFASGLRRSEIVALDVEDVSFTSATATLAIRKSKTDQTGKGRIAGIGQDATQRVRGYLDITGATTGPLFTSVNGKRLDGKEVARAIKRRSKEAGIEADLSAHSTRVGATVDALSAGQSAEQVQRAHGWKSGVMVAQYGRNVQAQRDARERETAIKRLYAQG